MLYGLSVEAEVDGTLASLGNEELHLGGGKRLVPRARDAYRDH